MAKNRTPSTPPTLRERYSRLSPKKQRRLLMKTGGAAALVAISAGALATYDNRQRTLHDLTVIGAGLPTVVQIHDPSCPTCRSLKSRVSEVLSQFDGVNFRLADITTNEGRDLQMKFSAEKITLLLFDARGKHLQTVVRLQSVEDLAELFRFRFAIQ